MSARVASTQVRLAEFRRNVENVDMIYLGIDSGTQSTKTIALDLDSGDILAQAQETYSLIDGLPNGHLEQHPSDWTEATAKTVQSVLFQLGDRKQEVRGIGVSGQQHGLVVLDEADHPVRAAKLWCDTSTAPQCDAMATHFGGQEAIIAKAGNAMLPGYTAPKILWLKENEPDNFAKTKSVLLPHDYLNFWLTDVKRMEYGDASGMAILDVRKRVWCDELIDHIDPRLREMLPPLGSSSEAHGTLKPSLAKEWGLTNEVIVSAGGGDNMMGAIGTGNVRAGVITASLGTSGTLFGSADAPVIDDQGEIAAFCDSTDQWMPLVCTMNVTVLTEKTRGLFAWELPELEKNVASISPGADGLLFLPYLHGERTPNLPNGKAVLYGLTDENMTPAHMARAAMEGVTLGLGHGMQRFSDLGVSPTEIRLTGGGSKSSVWRQIMADALGSATVCLQTAEGASLGAALQAAACHTGGGNFDRSGLESLTSRIVAVDQASRCEPHPEAQAAYAEQRDRQMKLTRELNAGGWL
ncbi:MAG: xylulokinase [Verrucomicrobiales bacterium]|nr:xylulokinase [Verrucomicrobiales bacterium]